jgi:hypothetical protein
MMHPVVVYHACKFVGHIVMCFAVLSLFTVLSLLLMDEFLCCHYMFV